VILKMDKDHGLSPSSEECPSPIWRHVRKEWLRLKWRSLPRVGPAGSDLAAQCGPFSKVWVCIHAAYASPSIIFDDRCTGCTRPLPLYGLTTTLSHLILTTGAARDDKPVGTDLLSTGHFIIGC